MLYSSPWETVQEQTYLQAVDKQEGTGRKQRAQALGKMGEKNLGYNNFNTTLPKAARTQLHFT